MAVSSAIDTSVFSINAACALGAGLSAREVQCIFLASLGRTNRDIGVALGTTANTVIAHLTHARDKLGAENKTHTVAEAFRRGVIS
jgi:LuxR family quorum sensing-dependent transcriptional regulator